MFKTSTKFQYVFHMLNHKKHQKHVRLVSGKHRSDIFPWSYCISLLIWSNDIV